MFKPIKTLGQNFLIDTEISQDIAEKLNICGFEDIIEIGPGTGMVTRFLFENIKNTSSTLFAVEIDDRFASKLESDYKGVENVKVIQSNILDFLPEFNSDREVKIVGSLPYYITSPIIHAVIRMSNVPSICVFIVQKEVAKKACADKPDSSYLSSFIQTFFNVEYIYSVSKDKFNPVPKVDGAVIRFTKKKNNFDIDFIKKYEGFLHRGFASPRKMLNKQFSQQELEKGKINPALRPQNLSADDWVKFFKVLYL